MGSAEFIGCSVSAELVERVARDWSEIIRNRPFGQPFCVALPGGRIVPRLFHAFVDLVKTQTLDLTAVHFFWGDERCVPPSSPDANFSIAQEHLFGALQIPSSQIHRIPAEMASVAAAVEAERELRRVLLRPESDTPVIQLVFLGMGEDGHVASLFPGESEELLKDTRIYRLVRGSKPPPLRVTLGYSAIAAAREVWVVASGPGKEEALRKSLDDRSTPMGRVIDLRHRTRVYSDIPYVKT